MSGHSKWSTIKHKKALTDAKRSKAFSKFAKIISIAAKGDPNPETNSQLKSAIDKARTVNMPNINIERAIKKASGKDATQLTQVQFEILGPSQVAIIVGAITDNSNRTLGDIRQILMKNNAKLASPGAVAWMFEKLGVIKTASLTDPENKRQNLVAEDMELEIIEAGAQDMRKEGDTLIIYTKPELLEQVKSTIVAMELPVEYAENELVPKTSVVIDNPDTKEKLEKLFEALDDHEEVEYIYSNSIL
jgi:YebC/PmpR family DNA-binding regulatory protein